MKKIFAIMLALMLALTGLAYAEPVLEIAEPEFPFVLVRFVTPATETTPATESYALLGTGDGQEAFAIYGETTAEGEQIYAALWMNALNALQPTITIEGAFESLIFTTAMDEAAQVEKTIVLMNGETVLEVEGLSAFVMLSAVLGEIVPQIDANCAAYIWTPDGLYQAAEICENCGAAKIGDTHTTEISQFCKENHTLCMGDPIHECDGCDRSYKCSASNSHTKCIKCGELWCYKAEGNHKEEACGHRGCEIYGEEEKHAKCVGCGKFLCNGKDHELEACGAHHKGEAGDHSAAECGPHFVCDGKDHVMAECNAHWACDGGDHSMAACGGHYACDEGDHAQAECGHYACAEGEHDKLECGHFACAEGEHGKLACGEFACVGGEHGAQECGHYACAGAHGKYDCGHFTCAEGEAEDHEELDCGHYACVELEFDCLHEICACGAYDCNGNDHSACA